MAEAGAGHPVAGSADAPAAPRPPWWKRVNTTILAAGALAVAVLAIVSLVQWVLPDDEPDPEDRAQFTAVRITPGVPLSEYQQRRTLTPLGPAGDDDDRPVVDGPALDHTADDDERRLDEHRSLDLDGTVNVDKPVGRPRRRLGCRRRHRGDADHRIAGGVRHDGLPRVGGRHRVHGRRRLRRPRREPSPTGRRGRKGGADPPRRSV